MKDHEENKYRLILGVILAALVLIGLTFFFFGDSDGYYTAEVELRDLKRQILVTGEVVSSEEVDLSFVVPGRLENLFIKDGERVKEGQVLATLNKTSVDAQLRQAIADNSLQKAELNSLKGLSVNDGKVNNVKRDSVRLIQNAFSVADNQVKTQADELFDDLDTNRPKITYAISNYFTQQQLNKDRKNVGDLLKEWKTKVSEVDVNNIDRELLDETFYFVSKIRNFFEDLNNALSDAESISNVSETELSSLRSGISTGRSALDEVLTNIISSREKLHNIIADIPVQEARLTASQAEVERLNSEVSNYVLRAPFSGVVVDVPVSVGESVSSNQIVISLISNDVLEIESFIPEVQMRDVSIDDEAKITLDAFGEDEEFDASIVFIDVRATELDGVATYKTILEIDDISPDIRAGMTANILLDTFKLERVLMIPKSSIISDVSEGKGIFVEILDGEDIRKVKVTLGKSDTFGNIEVVEGLEEGDLVILNK